MVLNSFTDKEIRNLPVQGLSDAQLQTRKSNIQTLVVANRAFLFLSRKLRDYQESKLNMVSYVFGLLWLIMYTVIAYGAINYALFKIDPSQFDVQNSSSGVFVFLYYSFHVFLFGSIPEITPIDFYSQLISMSEQFFAIVLLFIFDRALHRRSNRKVQRTTRSDDTRV